MEKINDGDFDFMLLDLGLPDKDGLAILTEIKKAQPETAVIILTARGSINDKIKGLILNHDHSSLADYHSLGR